MTIFLRTSKLSCYYMVGLGAPYLEYPNWPDIQTNPSSCIETEIVQKLPPIKITIFIHRKCIEWAAVAVL